MPAGFDRSSVINRLISPRCPRVFARQSRWRSIGEWRALGVLSQGRPWPADSVQATLIEPDGPGRTAYLLTGNYRVILDYNCSNFYALSVGLLADAVATIGLLGLALPGAATGDRAGRAAAVGRASATSDRSPTATTRSAMAVVRRELPGNRTASGAPFDPSALHRRAPHAAVADRMSR